MDINKLERWKLMKISKECYSVCMAMPKNMNDEQRNIYEDNSIQWGMCQRILHGGYVDVNEVTELDIARWIAMMSLERIKQEMIKQIPLTTTLDP